ncbi:protein of unknown function [Clostridium beijerinckii]|nr:protein of unknown function [Clostridium beijerinckii]
MIFFLNVHYTKCVDGCILKLYILRLLIPIDAHSLKKSKISNFNTGRERNYGRRSS